MLKTIWNILKKECSRFFKDRRMVFTAIILPAVSLYALYTLMGEGLTQTMTVPEDYVSKCYVQNMPETFSAVFDELSFAVEDVSDIDAAKQGISEKEADLLVIFPEDFDHMLQQQTVPNIEVYYNSGTIESLNAYTVFTTAAEAFETSLANILDVNRHVENPDLATSSPMIASLLPMLIVTILFTGCAGIGPESIAGEKERGTIATLLVTPVSRTALAIGKVCSLSLFAILAGISGFVGTMLALPKAFGEEFDMNIYTASEYAALLCVIVSTVLLIVAITAVVSAYARSVKEANTFTASLTLLSSLAGVIPLFSIAFSGIGWRCIPVLSCILSLNDIFRLEYSAANIAVTCLSNLVYMLGLVVVLSKMFKSEKVMFHK